MFAASKSGRAVSAATTDQYFPYVPLLLETTSTNGQQNNTFLDSSTNNFTITRVGTPTQGSLTPYWPNGYWSWYFGGSGNYATTNTGGIGATVTTFTIECWIYATATPAGVTPAVIGDMQATNISNYISFGITPSNLLQLFWYDGATKSATGNTTIPLNTWTHIAASVNANAITLYVNGVSQTITGTSTLTNRTGTNGYFVFAQNLTNIYTGYISNVSVLNGTAKYSSSFTPSTTPLSVSTTNQTLLACYSNRFIDSNTATTAKTITITGTPTVQAFQPFSPAASYTPAAYGGSGYFNGSSDYLTLTNSTALNPGTGAFTFECWVYANSSTLSSGGASPSFLECKSNGLGVGINSSSQLAVAQSFVSFLLTDTVAFPVFQWVHVAVVRSGTNLSLYKNGTRVATSASNSTNFVANTLNYIANSGNTGGTNYWPGYISNMRLVIGTAVYDPTLTTLTVPTTPLTAITNTALLTNYTNAGIYDAAVQNNAITVGSAQASTTVAKWSPTSMKFNGTTDYLSIPSGPANFGTGDFTIEGWVNLSSAGGGFPQFISAGAAASPQFAFTSNTQIYFYDGTTTYAGTFTFTFGTWYYIAWTRASGVLKIYVNGTQLVSTAYAGAINLNTAFVGGYNNGAANGFFSGYIQDLRITKGVARTITTPTAAFPTR